MNKCPKIHHNDAYGSELLVNLVHAHKYLGEAALFALRFYVSWPSSVTSSKSSNKTKTSGSDKEE
jgi:hypothetical protein